MLQSLTLRNIALIEQLTITLHDGLHVLSGETGAGKSIVVDAVNLVLGGRADKDLIRTGTDRASVEAVFDLPDHPQIRDLLSRESIEYDGRTVTVYREMTTSGRNLCRICGVLTPLSVLRELSSWMMDIHGQHDHRFLMEPEMHLSYLDQMGDATFQRLREQVRVQCRQFIDVHRSYAKLVRKNEAKAERVALLEKELEVLHQASIRPGEEESLKSDCLRMSNHAKLADALRNAYRLLAAGESEKGCMEKVKEASEILRHLQEYGADLAQLSDRGEALYYELEELSFEIHRILDKVEEDPYQLEKAESRLDLIRNLKRKYGPTEEDIFRETEKLEAEYSELCGLDDRISEMAAEHKRLLGEYRQTARALSGLRHQLAEAFTDGMNRELHELGMTNAFFQVHFTEKDMNKPQMPRENGDDLVEFMITTNPGEPVKPLAKVASGGELSRIMLAVKVLEMGRSGVHSMVFDEIDTGISGRMAQVVAEKMRLISKNCQVICVTHLPQIAAAADFEYLVRKDVQGDRTFTTVRELDRTGRIQEIARMISGAEGITPDATIYAEKMLAAYG